MAKTRLKLIKLVPKKAPGEMPKTLLRRLAAEDWTQICVIVHDKAGQQYSYCSRGMTNAAVLYMLEVSKTALLNRIVE